MADSTQNEKKDKPNFFRGVRREFKKITWPTWGDIGKQTVLVTFITVVCAALIAGIDFLAKTGLEKLINL